MAVWSSIKYSKIQGFNRADAEFYKPGYQEFFERVKSYDGERISNFAYITDGIHASPQIVEDGTRYISAKCVKNNEFVIDNCIHISHEQNEQNPRTQLATGDVIITTVGTIGNVAVVEPYLTPCNCDRHVGIIRIKDPDNVSPYFLSTFLNSKYGKFQSLREAAGNVQLNLYVRNIGHIVVSRLGKYEEDIVACTRRAYLLRSKSKTLYSQVIHLIESELGLDKLSFQKPVGYMARFSTIGLSNTFNAGRIDAQCFAPNAIFYQSWLRNHARCDRLTHLLQGMAKGRQQEETSTGSTDYCSIKHISGHELTDASKCQSIADTPLAGQDDLLLAITGATIGKIGIVKRYKKLAFSGDLLCLKANSEINPHYLLAALDHTIGQVQFNRWITGSTNGHLAPRDVGRVLVPRLKEGIEALISGLVEESLSKRVESEKLLHQAKTRVEQIIEEAVRQ